MKPAAAQLRGFLRDPPASIAAILLFGPDDGLVRERADQLCQAVLGPAKDDPFRLAVLTGDVLRQDPARLADEAASIGLFGGKRVVRVREAGDALSKTLQFVLERAAGDSLILIEAGDLGRSSSLRKLAEAAPNAAAIACYADGPRELATLIREMMGQHNISIGEEAVSYLVQNLGENRLVSRQELEKLILLAGDGGRIGLDEAIASVGDSSVLAIEDVIYDSLDGDAGAVETALSRLFLEGQAAVTILRAAQRHAQKLHLAASLVAKGTAIDAVVNGMRPPIFFKYTDRFRGQLGAWPPERAQRLLKLLLQAELDCKTTVYPEETICRHALSLAGRLPGRPARR
ncbi:MAG TPA: DNA polymerase III subunit delta [Aliidongia sp.]|nr:DNA polymerase III subunit delta [Aliidongia sp.]